MIKITTDDFKIDEILNTMRTEKIGALVSFVGVVRDDDTAEMKIEIYEAMAEKVLGALELDAQRRFGVSAITIIHRYGNLKIGDNIVLIAIAAPHRKDAFGACEYLIDELKKHVPIWKEELPKAGNSA